MIYSTYRGAAENGFMKSFCTSRLLQFATIGGLAMFGCAVQAQAQAQSEAQLQAQAQNRVPGQDHVIVGLGAAYRAAYPGSDKSQVNPVPVFDITWGPLFANLRNGVGIKLIQKNRFTLGTSISVMPGRDSEDVPPGIGDLSLGAGGRVFVSFQEQGIIATVGATKGLVGDNKGVVADATVSLPIPLTSRLILIPTLGATWADSKYNNTFFGVDVGQAIASGLPRYTTSSGFRDASALMSVNYRLTPRISLGASGGVTSLLGNVRNSPLVAQRTRPSAFLSASYRF